MNVRRVITAGLIGVAMTGVALVGAQSASAANGTSLAGLAANNTLIPGERIVVLECWDARRTTWLLVREAGSWRRVAASGGTANSKLCGKGGYLATYRWTVDTLAPKNAEGVRYLQMATSAGPKYTYPKRVKMMTAEEMDEYLGTPTPTTPSSSPTPVTTPQPVTTPAPAPSPLYTMTPADTAYVSRLWDVAKTQPDRQLARCRSLANPLMDLDSRDFYELGAWSGEQLYKLTHQGALVATKLAYSVYCDGAFGIQTRIL